MSTFLGNGRWLLGIALGLCAQAGLAITIDQVTLQVNTGNGAGPRSVPGFPTTSQLQADEGKRFDFDLTDYGFEKTFAKGQADGFISFSEDGSSASLSKGLSITAFKAGDDLSLSLNIRGHYFTTMPMITEELSIGGILDNGFALVGGGASRVRYDLGLVPFIGHKTGLFENLQNRKNIPISDGLPQQTRELPIGTRIDFTDVLFVNAQLSATAVGGDFARSDFFDTATEQLTAAPVPEPPPALLFSAGLAGLLAWRQGRRATHRA